MFGTPALSPSAPWMVGLLWVLGAAVAHADAVVVATTAPNVGLGTVVRPGQRVEAAADAQVTLMERDGAVRVYRGGFTYAPAKPAKPAKVGKGVGDVIGALAQVVAPPQAMGQLGAVREPLDPPVCFTLPLPPAGLDRALAAAQAGCRLAARAAIADMVRAEVPTEVRVRVSGGVDGVFVEGAPMTITVMATLEGALHCRAEGPDAAITPLAPGPLAPDARLRLGEPFELPQKGAAAALVASAPFGVYKVTCVVLGGLTAEQEADPGLAWPAPELVRARFPTAQTAVGESTLVVRPE